MQMVCYAPNAKFYYGTTLDTLAANPFPIFGMCKWYVVPQNAKFYNGTTLDTLAADPFPIFGM